MRNVGHTASCLQAEAISFASRYSYPENSQPVIG